MKTSIREDRYGDFSEATAVTIMIKPKIQQAIAALSYEVGFPIDEVYNEMLEDGLDGYLFEHPW